MEFKQISLCAACAAALTLSMSAASAADAEIYGLVDMGGKYMRSGGENTFEMRSGQMNGSRFGLNIEEKISPNLTVYANLENGFDADTGELGDDERLFNRKSVMGIKTPYGTFEFGRTGALVSGNSGGIFAGQVSPFGITWQELQDSQIFSGSVGSRIDNGIRWESPRMAGFTLYAQASNGIDGDDSVASSAKDRYAALGATYRSGGLSLVFVADRNFMNNQSPLVNDKEARTFAPDDYSTYNIGGSYAFDGIKLYAGYQFGDGVQKVSKASDSMATVLGKNGPNVAKNEVHRKNMGFDTHAFVLGTDIDVAGGKLKIASGFAKGDGEYKTWRASDNSKQWDIDSDVKVYQFALGYLYPLSKRTDLYAGAAYVHQKNEESGQFFKTNGTADKTKTSHRCDTEITRTFLFGMRHRF